MAKRKQPRPGASEAEKQTPSAAPSVQQAAPRAHQPAKQAHLPAAGAPQLGPWQLSDDQRQRLQSALNSAQSHFTVTHSKASKGSSKRARTSGVKGQPRSDLHADRLGDVCRSARPSYAAETQAQVAGTQAQALAHTPHKHRAYAFAERGRLYCASRVRRCLCVLCRSLCPCAPLR